MGCFSQLQIFFTPRVFRLSAHVLSMLQPPSNIYFAIRSGFRSQQTSITTQRLALDRTSSVLHSFIFLFKSEY